MLKFVLWRNKKKWQIWGASIGVFVGLLLLLFALQVFLDVQVLVQGARDSNFLVLNKKIIGPLAKTPFSPSDIDSLRMQEFINDADPFISNQFEVYAEMSQLGFSSFLFFQSIPNKYLDIDTSQFHWKEGETIPVAMSSDYLTLYNFGFGASQGFPRLSADVVQSFTFEVSVGSGLNKKRFKARIYEFTRNVNSILVPIEFMDYANKEFGGGKTNEPNQVIVSTNNPYNRFLAQYLEDHKYEISKGGLIGGELKDALYLLISLILFIGIIIIGLSMLVFILNFKLLIAQSSEDIRLLIQLGHPVNSITRQLAGRLLGIFLGVAILVFALLIPIKFHLTSSIIEQGYELSSFLHPIVLISGISFCFFFLIINYQSIRYSVIKLA